VPRLALLPRANANRVYGESAFALTAAELAALGRGPLGGALGPATRETIGGVDYLVAATQGPLPDRQRRILSNLSGLHALFELVDGGMLRPLEVDLRAVLDDDLLTIQRYSGKTNETFTHLLVNLALAQCPDGHARLVDGERLTLLDPMCGRGTTLNRAAVYGMDAIGVEADRRHVDAFTSFFTTWLQDKRLRHKVERATLRKGRPVPVPVWRATYGEKRDVAHHRWVEVVQADTATTPEHVSPGSVDVVVCDLPYGVQHGARREASLARTPEALLEAALPGWARALRPGGGVALAWNRRTLPRSHLAELVIGAGLEVPTPDDDVFVHRVDRSITRDVLVAQRR